MKKLCEIIISLTLIFAFSSTLIFCCSFQEALADTEQHCEHGYDQSGKADHQHDSHSSQDCMCQQKFIADFSKSFNIQLVSSHLFNKFLKDAMVLGRSFNFTSSNQVRLLADRSPPLLAAVSIPIYLKISNLRL